MSILTLLLVVIAPQDPLAGQLPKQDLGVQEFLAQNPDYDGRGIRVAVLDTGIDPGHPFLQRTPAGGRKIVDWYDATSDGRVAVQHWSPAHQGKLTGLSGRRLDLGRYAAAGRQYGLMRLDLDWLPDDLEGRIQGQRRQAWQRGARFYQEEQQRHRAAGLEVDPNSVEQALDEQRWSAFADEGPVWDAVVFELDGHRVVVVDNDEDGDLGEEPALAAFRSSGDWATLGDEALLNYAVSMPSPNEVHFYFDAHGHGTHVAGIIGAWEGAGRRMNGVAPAVEFVSIKIGDGKFGGSTSGFAITKALDYAVEAGCQVANISFGGPSFFADGKEPDGWVVEEATRRGLFVVTSAGNEGPALTTVGAPATTPAAFSIAAAVWPDTQRVNYGSLDPSAAVLFDFSSRGPLPNGALGIDFAAPGAALSTLPSWGIAKGENWNGTSMAAPQMSGCIALLLCAARAEQLAHGPARVERALRLSARPLPQHAWVEQGHGYVQLPDALSSLRMLDKYGAAEQGFEVVASNPFGDGPGIYHRGLASRRPFEVSVSVAPSFAEDTANAVKADFLRTFRAEAEQNWVSVPPAFYSNGRGGRLTVRVDPSELAPGLHSTRVLLWDADKPRELGPDLIVPVTVVQPAITSAAEDHAFRSVMELRPGQLDRSFVQVPAGATRARVQVTQRGGGRNEIRAGAGSVSGFLYSGDRQARGRYYLQSDETYETVVPVEAGTVFEYAMASRWSTNTAATFELKVQFLGLVPQLSEVVVPAGQDLGYLAVKDLLHGGTYSVSAKVEGIAVPVLEEMVIEPDRIRPLVMGNRGMFRGLLRWQLEVPDGGSSLVLRMPHSIQTTELREDLMVTVTDANGQVHGRHIAYEIDTDLGQFKAGSYHFEMEFPSIGKEALETRYAGVEIRIASGGGAVRVANSLEQALSGGSGARLNLAYGGARSAVLAMPELEPLADGRYYYGAVTFKRGDDAVLAVPLQVGRPQASALPESTEAVVPDASLTVSLETENTSVDAAGAAAEDGAADDLAAAGEGDEDTTLAALHKAYLEALASEHDAGRARRIFDAALAWKEGAPLQYGAELALYQSVADAGLVERAREMGRGFLRRFPREAETFVLAASTWGS